MSSIEETMSASEQEIIDLVRESRRLTFLKFDVLNKIDTDTGDLLSCNEAQVNITTAARSAVIREFDVKIEKTLNNLEEKSSELKLVDE